MNEILQILEEAREAIGGTTQNMRDITAALFSGESDEKSCLEMGNYSFEEWALMIEEGDNRGWED